VFASVRWHPKRSKKPMYISMFYLDTCVVVRHNPRWVRGCSCG